MVPFLGPSCLEPTVYPRSFYSPECVEGEFCELRLYGLLRSSGTLGLAQEGGRIISVAPVLDDLTVRYAEHVDGPHLHPLAGRSDPLEIPRWVPRMTTRAATRSPSAIKPS